MEKHEIECYQKAGRIAKEVKEYALSLVKPEMKLLDIAEKIEGKIAEFGGDLAFPLNLSLNEIAAHYTPCFDDETIAEGLLKIDLGVAIDGYIADCAFSVDLTDGEFKEMIELNKKALDNALAVLKPGMEIREIGNSIQDVVEGSEFSVIKNLSGHSLGKNRIHAGLTLSNYRNDNKNKIKDIAIAIEPFLTKGEGKVYEGKESEIFMLEADRNVRDSDARNILKFIKEKYSTRPFCKRWLVKEGFKRIDFSLKILTQQGILHNFPVLIEKSKRPVSQEEESILVLDDRVEIITR